MEGMTKRLDALSFTAGHGARSALSPAARRGFSRPAYGRETAANFFPNGAQKYQMWGFVPEAPQGGTGISLAEIASVTWLNKASKLGVFEGDREISPPVPHPCWPTMATRR